MRAYIEVEKIQGCYIEGEHPLPIFRDMEENKPSRGDGTLAAEEEKQLGEHTGFRVLPYRMQDKYSREKKPIFLKTVVLENEKRRAVFLPEYGGRLQSFVNKETGKEILYRNPVFQPANLGIRNAWFSGGVEWNAAQYGHTVYSSSPVYFAKCIGKDGEEFVRMYEFERMKRLYIQIDFHLPKGAETLFLHVKIQNLDDEKKSMYWWTNIAIQAEEKLRVFSGTDEVMYLHPESISDNVNPVRVFGHTRLPDLPTLPGKDSSYPSNADYSNEFFFQNPEKPEACWSAAAYGDGRVFFEESTLPLRYRKMFCWGRHPGGRRWCSYLATETEGNYVELQAGLTPTQLNGIEIPGKTVWEFTQAIGETRMEDIQAPYQKDYGRARKSVEQQVHQALGEEELACWEAYFKEMSVKKAERILSAGTGWGTLERQRCEKEGEGFPFWLEFEDSALGAPQYPWMFLLENGFLPELDVMEAPKSWMVDAKFEHLLRHSLADQKGDHYLAHLHMGVMEYENGNRTAGINEWRKSLEQKASPIAYRNLAYDEKMQGNQNQAIEYMKKAVELEDNKIDKVFSEEYMALLLEAKRYENAWDYYCSLPMKRQESDRLTLQAGLAGVEIGQEAFVEAVLHREFSCIREGDTSLTDLYFRYQAKKRMQEIKDCDEQEAARYVEENLNPPEEIDFRMFVKRERTDENKYRERNFPAT